MSEIIVLTIGPIQNYIGQARRTQDLWQGSRILSYLAGAGVYHASQQASARVIYPIVESNQTDNIPNRIVVLWDGDGSGAQSCAEGMETAIRAAWQEVSKNTRDFFVDRLGERSLENVVGIWQPQVNAWLECYWVAVPYDAKLDYAVNLQAANNAMGARKLLRNFPPIQERGRKCSITGEHEALQDERGYVTFWEDQRANQKNLALLGKHKRLSAISTIKWFAHEEVPLGGDQWRPINPALAIQYRFPSTSSIAAVPFKCDVLEKLADNTVDERARQRLAEALEAYIESLLVAFENPVIPDP